MSQVFAEKKVLAISVAAAAATVAAGILHILMAPNALNENAGEGTLFLVGGVVQVFWAVPVLKRWGRIWQAIGIGGTLVFTALWFATHTHSLFGQASHVPGGANMSQGGGHLRAGRPRGIASIPQIEYFQIAFVALYGTLAAMLSKGKHDRS